MDAVFIDELHTYEGVVMDINAWVKKLKHKGSVLFNDYQDIRNEPGDYQAVKEEEERQNNENWIEDRRKARIKGNEGGIRVEGRGRE